MDTLTPTTEPFTNDPHPYRAAIILTLATIVLGLAASMYVLTLAGFPGMWQQSGDLWIHAKAASYVANGAVFDIYGAANPHFVAMPGYAVALAPIMVVIEHFELIMGHPFRLARPSAWLPLLGWALLFTLPLYLGVRNLVASFGVRKRLWIIQVMMVPLVVVPIGILGHFEDVLMLGFALLAVAALRKGHPIRSAWMFAIALSTKQLAILLLPLLYLQVPKDYRSRFLVHALTLPVLLVVGTFALDWPNASEALLRAPTFPGVGHAVPWLSTSEVAVSAGPYRLITLALVVALAAWLRRPSRDAVVLAAMALAFLARMPGEIVWHPYYLAPALACAVIYEFVQTGRVWRTGWLGTLAFAWFMADLPIWLWWPAMLALLIVIFYPAGRDVVASRPALSRIAHAGAEMA